MRIIGSMAKHIEASAPSASVVFRAVHAFALSIWRSEPLTNLLLRFNRFSRHLADKEQKLKQHLDWIIGTDWHQLACACIILTRRWIALGLSGC